ncbi:MAG: marine proteobacterial sortase target protein [Hyphomicrobiales bacterium]|nr:marine proteobacterial sortase target protein [Hyphomicrobiales bacterium]MCP5373114.1 marine proteobacterial sortase target protein [Hyphomicrobiales bacterium]
MPTESVAAAARRSCYIPSTWPPARRPFLPTAGGHRAPAWVLAWRVTLAIIAGFFLVLLSLDGAEAAPPPVTAEEAEKGGLYFPDGDSGLFRPAPLLDTEVSVDVSGPVARYTVVHKFRNPDQAWVEGVYVFPLPEDSAVDRMRLVIGKRIIEGRIDEKQKARQTYETAKREGRKASLVEQERPNIFTTSVANIGPGEEVSVEIHFQEVLRFDAGSFRLRFPLVVGPRYIPGAKPVAGFGGTGWAVNTPQVPDAERISPPVRRPDEGKDNPVRLTLRLDPGFPLASLASPSHAIDVAEKDGGRREITLKDGDVPADRDFVLEWAPQAGAEPQAGLFRETVDGRDYLLLMLLPPELQAVEAQKLPREVIFVIDTSGSMHGPSLAQAKAALDQALDRLTPADRFNVVQFNSATSVLFPAARPADAGNVSAAHAYVATLEAQGGTEMMGAVEAALDGRADPKRVRQVVFITDGAVGNEVALLQRIHGKLADSRLFTVGIGSAPNGFFMTEAARTGRGTYTYIDDVAQVGTRMAELYRKLEHPALTDIRLTLPAGMTAEVQPDPVPDLYAGEPLVVTLNPAKAEGEIAIAGRLNGAVWHTTVPLGGGSDNPGVGKVWARAKIASLMGALRLGADREATRAAVLNVALPHQLVSAYTSLVAVDLTVSRPADKDVDTRAVPTNMPHGWSHGAVFGPDGQPRPAPMPAPAGMQRKAMAPGTANGIVAMAEASRAPGVAIGTGLRAKATPLPQTATPAAWHLVTGLVAVLLGLLLMMTLAWRPGKARP